MQGEDTKLNFEQAIRQLEETVEVLESGDLGLEESLAAFERGMSLVRICQKKLDEAETKIAKLVELKDGGLATEPFRLEEGTG